MAKMNNINGMLTPIERSMLMQAIGYDIKKKEGKLNNIENITYDDTNPSLSIDLDNGAVNDYGTGYTGDIVSFVQDTTGKTFPETVSFMEGVLRRPLNPEKDQLDFRKTPEKSKKPKTKKKAPPKKFWTGGRIEGIKKCQTVLEEHGIKKSMSFIRDYDGISQKTLRKYRCGLYGFKDYEFGMAEYDYNKELFYIFPYITGAQIYRRGEKGKVIKHIKESSAGGSFFGVTGDEKKRNIIFLMKSPRECMSFSQFATDWKSIGLCCGEEVKELSVIQERQLDSIVSPGECILYVVTDCDKPKEAKKSLRLCELLANYLAGKVQVNRVNIYAQSEGKYKDFTDMVQQAMRSELYWTPEGHTRLTAEGMDTLYKSINNSKTILP